MRLERICVRRLKSFCDYSNVAVELCASLDQDDSVDAAYTELLKKINILIERTREIESLEDLRKRVEEEASSVEDLRNRLRAVLMELEEQRKILSEALLEAKTLIEQTKASRSRLAQLVDYLRSRLG